MKLNNKTILVTGGLGHIGSKLIQDLQANNNNVIVVDNLHTQRFSSLFGMLGKSNFKFIDQTLQSKECVNQIKKSADAFNSSLDFVIHLAAYTDAASSFDREHELKENNLESTKAAIEITDFYGAKLIYPSSTSVYGENDKLVTETSITSPQSPYAESKIEEEQVVLQSNIKSCILRLGTIAGPSKGMRFHTAVNSFIWKSLNNKPITIWSTAFDQYRPYLVLKDAVSAIHHASFLNISHSDIYNVLSENSTPHIISDIIKKEIPNLQIEFVDSKIMNQLNYKVSSEKFENTGFNFQNSLESAIKSTIKYLL